MSALKRYIIMPDRSYRGGELEKGSLQASSPLTVRRRPSDPPESVTILDRISNKGPLLVEASPEGELALKQEYGLRIKIVPLQSYSRPDPHLEVRGFDAQGRKVGPSPNGCTLSITDRKSGLPISGAHVLAFTKWRSQEGVEGWSDPQGIVSLDLDPGSWVDRLYVIPVADYWSCLRSDIKLSPTTIGLLPIRLDDPCHVVPLLYGTLPMNAGEGVTIGVVDTGVDASHPMLDVAGGRNCVYDELAGEDADHLDFADISDHGTHVAGVMAARQGIRGVAPGARVRAYRVFPKRGGGATNFDIMKAMEVAVQDGCQIINLSLGAPANDDAVRGAIGDALQKGVTVVAAAGNQGRQPVLFPASHEPVVAVTAVGIAGTYPEDSCECTESCGPYSDLSDRIFLARFSNFGPQVDITAPGLGIASTVPGGRHAVQSGTSMAAPVVSGFLAYLLGQNSELMERRDQSRVDELVRRLYEACAPLQLGREYEGLGLPLPIDAAAIPALLARIAQRQV